MCLGNISKNFTVENMKKSELTGHVYDFSVDFSDITNIYKYLMKGYNITSCLDKVN